MAQKGSKIPRSKNFNYEYHSFTRHRFFSEGIEQAHSLSSSAILQFIVAFETDRLWDFFEKAPPTRLDEKESDEDPNFPIQNS